MTSLLHGAGLLEQLHCDGRPVIIRTVHPRDSAPMAAFVEQGLSPASRRARFHAPIRSLPPTQLAALTQVDQVKHVALVAECVEAEGVASGATVIVAEARFVIDAAGHPAEVALAVADAWQGVGLGSALLGHLCRLGRLHGVLHFQADVMAGNDAMLALLRRRGSLKCRHPDDATLCRVYVPTSGLDLPVDRQRMAIASRTSTRRSSPSAPRREQGIPCILGDS